MCFKTVSLVHGFMGSWVHGLMGGWVHGCMDSWVHGVELSKRLYGSCWVHGFMEWSYAWVPMHGIL